MLVRKDHGSGDWIRTGDTSGMNRMLWPTELRRHINRQTGQAGVSILQNQPLVNSFDHIFLTTFLLYFAFLPLHEADVMVR